MHSLPHPLCSSLATNIACALCVTPVLCLPSAEEVTAASAVTAARLEWTEKQNAAMRLRLREEQQLVNQQLAVAQTLAAALEQADARHPELRSAAVRASLVSGGILACESEYACSLKTHQV